MCSFSTIHTATCIPCLSGSRLSTRMRLRRLGRSRLRMPEVRLAKSVAAPNSGAKEVTLKGGPNPTAQFAYPFVSEDAALGGWRHEWVSRGVGVGMGLVC
ncbi:hypothetical protein RSAG8_10831, partial [Rhizoctonia solani AG-8 WAC10335]